jgi:hypothetical protein
VVAQSVGAFGQIGKYIRDLKARWSGTAAEDTAAARPAPGADRITPAATTDRVATADRSVAELGASLQRFTAGQTDADLTAALQKVNSHISEFTPRVVDEQTVMQRPAFSRLTQFKSDWNDFIGTARRLDRTGELGEVQAKFNKTFTELTDTYTKSELSTQQSIEATTQGMPRIDSVMSTVRKNISNDITSSPEWQLRFGVGNKALAALKEELSTGTLARAGIDPKLLENAQSAFRNLADSPLDRSSAVASIKELERGLDSLPAGTLSPRALTALKDLHSVASTMEGDGAVLSASLTRQATKGLIQQLEQKAAGSTVAATGSRLETPLADAFERSNRARADSSDLTAYRASRTASDKAADQLLDWARSRFSADEVKHLENMLTLSRDTAADAYHALSGERDFVYQNGASPLRTVPGIKDDITQPTLPPPEIRPAAPVKDVRLHDVVSNPDYGYNRAALRQTVQAVEKGLDKFPTIAKDDLKTLHQFIDNPTVDGAAQFSQAADRVVKALETTAGDVQTHNLAQNYVSRISTAARELTTPIADTDRSLLMRRLNSLAPEVKEQMGTAVADIETAAKQLSTAGSEAEMQAARDTFAKAQKRISDTIRGGEQADQINAAMQSVSQTSQAAGRMNIAAKPFINADSQAAAATGVAGQRARAATSNTTGDTGTLTGEPQAGRRVVDSRDGVGAQTTVRPAAATPPVEALEGKGTATGSALDRPPAPALRKPVVIQDSFVSAMTSDLKKAKIISPAAEKVAESFARLSEPMEAAAPAEQAAARINAYKAFSESTADLRKDISRAHADLQPKLLNRVDMVEQEATRKLVLQAAEDTPVGRVLKSELSAMADANPAFARKLSWQEFAQSGADTQNQLSARLWRASQNFDSNPAAYKAVVQEVQDAYANAIKLAKETGASAEKIEALETGSQRLAKTLQQDAHDAPVLTNASTSAPRPAPTVPDTTAADRTVPATRPVPPAVDTPAVIKPALVRDELDRALSKITSPSEQLPALRTEVNAAVERLAAETPTPANIKAFSNSFDRLLKEVPEAERAPLKLIRHDVELNAWRSAINDRLSTVADVPAAVVKQLHQDLDRLVQTTPDTAAIRTFARSFDKVLESSETLARDTNLIQLRNNIEASAWRSVLEDKLPTVPQAARPALTTVRENLDRLFNAPDTPALQKFAADFDKFINDAKGALKPEEMQPLLNIRNNIEAGALRGALDEGLTPISNVPTTAIRQLRQDLDRVLSGAYDAETVKAFTKNLDAVIERSAPRLERGPLEALTDVRNTITRRLESAVDQPAALRPALDAPHIHPEPRPVEIPPATETARPVEPPRTPERAVEPGPIERPTPVQQRYEDFERAFRRLADPAVTDIRAAADELKNTINAYNTELRSAAGAEPLPDQALLSERKIAEALQERAAEAMANAQRQAELLPTKLKELEAEPRPVPEPQAAAAAPASQPIASSVEQTRSAVADAAEQLAQAGKADKAQTPANIWLSYDKAVRNLDQALAAYRDAYRTATGQQQLPQQFEATLQQLRKGVADSVAESIRAQQMAENGLGYSLKRDAVLQIGATAGLTALGAVTVLDQMSRTIGDNQNSKYRIITANNTVAGGIDDSQRRSVDQGAPVVLAAADKRTVVDNGQSAVREQPLVVQTSYSANDDEARRAAAAVAAAEGDRIRQSNGALATPAAYTAPSGEMPLAAPGAMAAVTPDQWSKINALYFGGQVGAHYALFQKGAGEAESSIAAAPRLIPAAPTRIAQYGRPTGTSLYPGSRNPAGYMGPLRRANFYLGDNLALRAAANIDHGQGSSTGTQAGPLMQYAAAQIVAEQTAKKDVPENTGAHENDPTQTSVASNQPATGPAQRKNDQLSLTQIV